MDVFKLGGTFLRRISKYSIRPQSENDGTLIEEVLETAISDEGVCETTFNKGFTVLGCGHVIHDHSEIGCQCPYCGTLNCVNHCTHVCDRCLTTMGSCCAKIFRGRHVCLHCYRVLVAKQGAVLTGKFTGKVLSGTVKVLSIPFKGKSSV